MLTLQRASAGSGKTYSLARMYLHQLLAIRDENTGRYRLRTPAETRGAHSHLLAITFTNKATAEMRKRFVENLAKLAKADSHTDKVDYLKDFTEELGVSRSQVAETARAALTDILNHYSDFQVSTIDSFFQQILRSFTYEAELPDNYEVELDSDLVIGMAFDSLMHTARTDARSDEAFWIKQYTDLLLRNGKKWNLSQHDGQARRELFSYLKMMDSEAFKKQRAELGRYFSEHKAELRKLPAIVEDLGKDCISAAHSRAVASAEILKNRAKEIGEKEYLNSYLLARIEKVREATADKYPFSSEIKPYPSPLKQNKKRAEGAEDCIKELDKQLADDIKAWRTVTNYVAKVRQALPVVMLVNMLQRHLDQYRTDNNVVQLSDTNTILQTITGDSDVPFIYEKIGTQIDSYMIDEFQDTSELQWRNMSPLVDESLGRGNDNLIIGDAKQSIYRFRNADSTLITSKVPQEYGRKGHKLSICGEKTAENANWRSAPEIVRFNNSLFTYMAAKMHSAGSIADIASTYKGICQEPMKRELQGYVELNTCIPQKEDKDKDETEEKGADMPYLIPCITSLLKRGYLPKEIAVLVRTHKEGRTAVKAIIDYSATLSAEERIDVISDESLLISNAASVGIITTMLRAVRTDGVKRDKQKKKTDKHKKDSEHYSRRVDVFLDTVNRLRSDAPNLTSEEIMTLYFNCRATGNDVRHLLKDSPSMALPALVERIIGSGMVPEEMRRQEAAFISAFQDAVASFSERHQPDVAAFLDWWDDNKDSLTITSPEDADAVQVITIHKAKGLEWKCVIVPDLTCRLTLKSTESAWLGTREPFAQTLPPLLPVQLSSEKAFTGTPWQQDYVDITSQHRLDVLNLVYVAFTRAKDELYVYLPLPKDKDKEEKEGKTAKKKNDKEEKPKEPGYIRDYLITLNTDTDWLTQKCEFGIEESKLQLCPQGNETGGILTYGEKPSTEYISARRRKEEEDKRKDGPEPKAKILEDYKVNMNIPDINYKVGDLPPSESEGNVRKAIRLGDIEHAILEGIRPGHDPHAEADRLLLRALVKGQITEGEQKDLGQKLHELLDKPQAREWFGPDVKVYAERSLVDGRYHRPDRVVVDGDNVATVIDYKTGAYYPKHEKQVREYMNLLRQTGLFADVRGVLWYLDPEDRKKGEFVPVQ